jgi:hypothetical protein
VVVTILGEGHSGTAILVQLNAPTVEFDLAQPLLTVGSVTSELLVADNAQTCFERSGWISASGQALR